MASQAKRRRAEGPPDCREEGADGEDSEEEDDEEDDNEEEEEDTEEEELNEYQEPVLQWRQKQRKETVQILGKLCSCDVDGQQLYQEILDCSMLPSGWANMKISRPEKRLEFIEVNVEFEAHSISDNDHNGIKKLLQQLFLKAPVNTDELTDILIQQNHIGSVIKQAEVLEESDDEDDVDEVFGFISLLNLTERKGTQCAEQIKELILSQCEKNCEQSMVEQLDKLLSDTIKPVGFLLSERFINVPPQIALPMHQQLQKEMTEAQRTNKPCGKCHFYLLLSKTFTDAKSNRKKGSSAQTKEELMFSNAEEEFFYEKSLLKFSYSVQEESDMCLGGRWSFEDKPMKPLRTVMVIPADRMNSIMDKLKEYLSV